MPTLNVIVDHDNVILLRQRRHDEFALKLYDSLSIDFGIGDLEEVKLRFYGGWYKNNIPSRYNLEVSSLMADIFPLIYKECLIRAELARSLLSSPTVIIDDTFTNIAFPKNKRIRMNNSSNTCTYDGCRVKEMIGMINSGRCARGDCDLKLAEMIEMSGQKRVDSMMVADILDISDKGRDIVCVTSDSDIMPAILTALLRGVKVYHVANKINGNVLIDSNRQYSGNYHYGEL